MNRLLTLFRERNATAIGVLLAVLVVGAYLPSLQNGFVNLDDPIYASANPYVQKGLALESVRYAFTTFDRGFWHPLTWLSLMLDRELFGPGARGFHLTSLLLHAANTVLLFLVFKRLTGATWRSAMVAALFGLHPLHVESVAWVSERKDVLSTFFALLSLFAYARSVEERVKSEGRNPRTEQHKRGPLVGLAERSPKSEIRNPAAWYVSALVFFALGLMSKAMLVTLPLMMLLLDWWPLRRFNRSRTLGGQPSKVQSSEFDVRCSMFRPTLSSQLPNSQPPGPSSAKNSPFSPSPSRPE